VAPCLSCSVGMGTDRATDRATAETSMVAGTLAVPATKRHGRVHPQNIYVRMNLCNILVAMAFGALGMDLRETLTFLALEIHDLCSQ